MSSTAWSRSSSPAPSPRSSSSASPRASTAELERSAAQRFSDRAAYAARVLQGAPFPLPPHPPATIVSSSLVSIEYAIGSLLVALAAAGIGLWHESLPHAVRRGAARVLGPPVGVLRAGHSGIVGDYLLWIAAGTALVGGIWALTLT